MSKDGYLDEKGLAMAEKYKDYDEGFMAGVQCGIEAYYRELQRVKFSRLKARELKNQMCSEQGKVWLTALCKIFNKTRAQFEDV